MKDFSLVIASAFYEVKAYAPYIPSLVQSFKLLDGLGIRNDYYVLTGDSYVDRAKNSLVDKFLKSDFSHMMMIDSDEAWDLEGFGRVVKAAMAGCEVVGAAYPCKNNWEFYGCIPLRGEDGLVMGKEIGDMRLLDMWGIPGGFIIYSRAAFERTRPALKEYAHIETGGTILEAFRCNVEEDGTRIGEDIYFQKRYREMGGKVWLEPNVTIEHWGVKAWTGNYHDYLLRQKTEWEQEQALGLSADDTKRLLENLSTNETFLKAMDDISPEGYDYLGDMKS